MPTVSSGYTISIKSSTNENVIKKDGTIVPPDAETKVTLVFTVEHTSSGKTADTKSIEVTVPAKTAVDTDQEAVDNEASKITSVTEPTKDATTLTMPTVSSGYTISIKSSTNENVIKKDGTIVPPDAETKVTLVFTVEHTSSGKTADTKSIEVTVPAKTAVDTDQEAVDNEASKITSVTEPTKDATTLTMPTVSSGYTISIKSSTNENVIKKDGTIVPPDAETKVTLVFTVEHTSSGKTADTKSIEVTVPA
ncbi:cell wall-binding repeat-containing protein, partial [Clostridioides sp. ZZV14-6104]|nr:cell wall-binding repeat-containing protein [Clostridioides sp. ZZV14-6104]